VRQEHTQGERLILDWASNRRCVQQVGSTHRLSTCFRIVFGVTSNAARCSRTEPRSRCGKVVARSTVRPHPRAVQAAAHHYSHGRLIACFEMCGVSIVKISLIE
jgi:hypothetical protein